MKKATSYPHSTQIPNCYSPDLDGQVMGHSCVNIKGKTNIQVF